MHKEEGSPSGRFLLNQQRDMIGLIMHKQEGSQGTNAATFIFQKQDMAWKSCFDKRSIQLLAETKYYIFDSV